MRSLPESSSGEQRRGTSAGWGSCCRLQLVAITIILIIIVVVITISILFLIRIYNLITEFYRIQHLQILLGAVIFFFCATSTLTINITNTITITITIVIIISGIDIIAIKSRLSRCARIENGDLLVRRRRWSTGGLWAVLQTKPILVSLIMSKLIFLSGRKWWSTGGLFKYYSNHILIRVFW